MTKLDEDLSPEQIAVLKDRLNQPDPLRLLANMIALFADPARADLAIKQFQDAKAAAEKAQANLVTARAKHDEFIRTTTAELDERRSKLGAREIAFMHREAALQDAAERQKKELENLKRRFGVTEDFHSGMTREFADTGPDAADPHYAGVRS